MARPLTSTLRPAPQFDWLRAIKREKPRATLKGAVSMRLPDRLSMALVERLSGDGTNWGLMQLAEMKDALLEQIERQLSGWAFHPNGTEGYAKAEAGRRAASARRNCPSSKTLEAAKLPASTRLWKRSTSRAGWAAITSNGRGRAALQQPRRFPRAASPESAFRCRTSAR